VAWWGADERNKRTNKVIELFEQKYPNIKIEGKSAGFADYWDQMAMKTADQDLPDVIQMDYAYINEYASRKFIEPLDPYVKNGQINLTMLIKYMSVPGKLTNSYLGFLSELTPLPCCMIKPLS
jgi:multiple sugar transport system substrate-binding protein